MRSEFKSATQIYVNPIHFEIQLILRNDLFSHDDHNWWNWKNCPKFFHRVIFALWIQICNPNLCKSHIFKITANIEKWSFLHDLMTKIDEIGKIALKFFHRVIFALWIQICNPNLCKSHIFYITANIEKWSFFAYPDLMTKIDEIKNIARNSLIGQFLRSEFKSATQIYVSLIYFELQLILRNDFFLHTRTWWPKSMKSEELPEILS